MKNEKITVSFILGHRYGVGVAEAIKELFLNTNLTVNIGIVACLHPKHSILTGGYSDSRSILKKSKITSVLFDDINEDEIVDIIRKSKPNFIIMCGLRQILHEKVLRITSEVSERRTLFGKTHGVIGIHPGFLPANAGASPVQWAILKKLENIGVTAFFLDGKGIDSGPIITCKNIPISRTYDAKVIDQCISDSIKEVITEIFSMLPVGVSYNLSKESKKEPFSKQLKVIDSWLDFTKTADEIILTVRAFTYPYRMAFFVYSGVVVHVKYADKSYHTKKSKSGEIINHQDGRIDISCKDGVVHLSGLVHAQSNLDFKVGRII